MTTPAPLFRKGETVVLSTTRDHGRVEADPDRRQGDYWYRVNFGKRELRKSSRTIWKHCLKHMTQSRILPSTAAGAEYKLFAVPWLSSE